MTSRLLMTASVGAAVAISFAMDAAILVVRTSESPFLVVGVALLFNGACVLMSVVGAVIEWRRPGHLIGRLLLIGGPLYAVLAVGWVAGEGLVDHMDPYPYQLLNWAGLLLSYPGMALIAGWIPLLFPTGTLPGPRWRLPAGSLVVLSGIGLAAWAVRPGDLVEAVDSPNPFGIAGWPTALQPLIDAIPLELAALIVLAVAGLVTRYRRGDVVERLQIRWFLASVAIIAVGFVCIAVEQGLRRDDGPLAAAFVTYLGILAMPVAIGIAVTRHRLYEIDRLISRTVAWALVTGIVVAVFVVGVLVLQAALGSFTQGDTLAVAGSTLIAFAASRPIHTRVQAIVDRRFHRARRDADRAVAAFGDRLRDQVDLDVIVRELRDSARHATQPAAATVWLRASTRNDLRTKEA